MANSIGCLSKGNPPALFLANRTPILFKYLVVCPSSQGRWACPPLGMTPWPDSGQLNIKRRSSQGHLRASFLSWWKGGIWGPFFHPTEPAVPAIKMMLWRCDAWSYCGHLITKEKAQRNAKTLNPYPNVEPLSTHWSHLTLDFLYVRKNIPPFVQDAVTYSRTCPDWFRFVAQLSGF